MKKKKVSQPKVAKSANFSAKVLKAMIAEAASLGWSEKAYNNALKVAKVTPEEAAQFFPDRVTDLVLLYSVTLDEAMEAKVKAEKSYGRMRVREKVGFAVKARFDAMEKDREAIKRLLFWYAYPQHCFVAFRNLSKTVDRVWQAAGDVSEDYNYYTKRFLLAAVVKVTLLYWLRDESPNHKSTWLFLEQRLDEVVRVGKSLSLLKELKPREIVEALNQRFRRA